MSITFKSLCVFRTKGPDTNEDKTSSSGDLDSQTVSKAVSSKTYIQNDFKMLAQLFHPPKLPVMSSIKSSTFPSHRDWRANDIAGSPIT